MLPFYRPWQYSTPRNLNSPRNRSNPRLRRSTRSHRSDGALYHRAGSKPSPNYVSLVRLLIHIKRSRGNLTSRYQSSSNNHAWHSLSFIRQRHAQ